MPEAKLSFERRRRRRSELHAYASGMSVWKEMRALVNCGERLVREALTSQTAERVVETVGTQILEAVILKGQVNPVPLTLNVVISLAGGSLLSKRRITSLT